MQTTAETTAEMLIENKFCHEAIWHLVELFNNSPEKFKSCAG